jgi:nucleotidyltransferase/DNA polymerase involved in DNA repair
MDDSPLAIRSFPRAIVHIDGDAFFASCEQSKNPKLQGKPVVTGKERGIAASMSYEAKARGVTRGMTLRQIRQVCPEAIILPSDYETYSLLSLRMFAIVRRYTPDVEEYSIDECFADLTGLRRPLRMSYREMAVRLKYDLDRELGFTFSVGLAPNKVLAKLASKWRKPSGLTVIPGQEIPHYLAELPVDKIWGIGEQTRAYLQKQGIRTALALARRPEAWVRKHLTKPFVQIWQELNGHVIFPLETQAKATYASIQKVRTFTPPSSDEAYVFGQLSRNIENACAKARRYQLAARGAIVFLRTQEYRHMGLEVALSRPTNLAHQLVEVVRPSFGRIFSSARQYRMTGVVLLKLQPETTRQLDLFGETLRAERIRQVYTAMDVLNRKYGKYTVYLGSSHPAITRAPHDGARGDLPERQRTLLTGETARKHLGLPFLGDVH